MTTALHTVHVRVNDVATGQPTPVRIRFATPEGQSFAPLGRLTDFAIGDNEDVGGNLLLGSQPYAYIDGSCEIRLPAGRILLEIHKGPEYAPRFLETTLSAGKLALRLEVERWIDLRRDGWYSGDIRAHALAPHAALLEAAAEDLAVVNLLARDMEIRCLHECPAPNLIQGIDITKIPRHRALSNILAFSGQRPALEIPGHLVVVNTHNAYPILGSPILGSLGLLNCHRVVYPLRLDESKGLGDCTLADCADQCHRKGGLVVWMEMHTRDMDGAGWLYGEPLADLLLGKIDAVEVSGSNALDCPERHWYAFLNCGCRVPLVGSSGKQNNTEPLGSQRTYARLQPGQEFNYQTWIEAIRAGRTFITNGPLVSFTVNGQDPGAVLNLPSLEQPVEVFLEARSLVPFDRLELLLNGELLHGVEASGSPASARFQGSVRLPAAGWLAARCTGSHKLVVASTLRQLEPRTLKIFEQSVAAHTSPIYVQVEARSPPPDARSVAKVLGHLDKMLAWVAQQNRSGNGQQPRRLVEILESARDRLTKHASS